MKPYEHYHERITAFIAATVAAWRAANPGQLEPAELEASAIGDDPAILEARLWSCAALLRPDLKALMRRARFDAAARTLTGNGLRLTYRIRPDPAAPISYRNQQTSWGHVAIEAIPHPDAAKPLDNL